ncbi:Inner membrane transport permease YbhR [Enhygromyxa salina]|uniref:Inner membrane transport permease YbhR n=1 Tax=Enhygromyxa salina TaxID=215803 RepID=A0A2S9YAL3_9BACT|nr:ABC transporter permease [Enhygromyxa salina]PRQ02143.1 Inner membrane transport permease YbhR [Enhygromyxa salina]
MHAIWSLMVKDLRLLLRDRGAVFLTFAWPLVLATFFGALGPGFGAQLDDEGGGAMTVLAVDEDRSAASEALLTELDADPRVTLEPAKLEPAREAVRTGASPAYLRLAAGFGGPRARGELRTVELGVDPRRRAEAEVLAGATELAAWRARARTLPGASPAPAPARPLELDYHSVEPGSASANARPPSPYAVTFPQGIIWAVIACAATFAVSLVEERKRGTLARLAVAPVSRLSILAGKAGACLVAIVIMEITLVLVALLGFGVRPQSVGLLVLALACTALGFVGVMTLLAVLGRRTQSAAGLSWAILMAMAMLGGGMLPLFLMPSWLQLAASASPVAWALTAIEGAVWRGFSVAELAPPCAALLVLGGVCLALGARAVREL